MVLDILVLLQDKMKKNTTLDATDYEEIFSAILKEFDWEDKKVLFQLLDEVFSFDSKKPDSEKISSMIGRKLTEIEQWKLDVLWSANKLSLQSSLFVENP